MRRLQPRADLGGKGPSPQDAKHCATWHWNNTTVMCTAIKKTPPMASNYAFHFDLALNFRPPPETPFHRSLKCSSFSSVPGPLPGLRIWTPLLINRWIKHSQQTMNQYNKISSVRPGTINIELGLDLYVLLYYRGLRSVDMIFTDYSQHIPKITASPVCTAINKKPSWCWQQARRV